jgi:hypothetical protein
MRILSRKILISVISLTFALFALGTATFAWFTLSDTVTVSQFSATVTSSDGIEVSLGSSNLDFYTNIPLSVVTSFLNGAGFGSNFRMNHITSQNGLTFVDMNGNAKTDFSYKEGYIQFQLRFRSLTPGVKIYLANGSGLSSDAKNWASDADFINSKGTNIATGEARDYYIANAARFSFSTVEGGTEKVKIVYELPENAYGATTNAQYGNKVLNQATQLEGAVHYFNQKNGLISYPAEGQIYNGLVYTGKTLPASTTTFVGQSPIVTLGTTPDEGYYYGVVTLRVWIEGWDPDCFDALYGSNLKIDLKFTTVQPTA